MGDVWVKPSLNNVRLRDKMLILFILSVFIPIVATNLIFYQVTTENIKDQKMKDISLSLQQVKNEFRDEINDAVGLSTEFYTDVFMNEILEKEYEETHEYVAAYDSYLRRLLSNPTYNSIQTITIYVDNPTVLHSGGIGFISTEVKQKEWYKRGHDKQQTQPILIRTESNAGKRDTFSIIRKLDYYASLDVMTKVLKIDLRTISIEQIFSNLNLQGNMYLLNPQGQIEFTTNPNIEWETETVNYDAIDQTQDTIEFSEAYTTANYLEGWRVVGTVAEDVVFQDVTHSRSLVLWSASIILILPTLIIIWMTRSINARIIKILKYMKRVRNQNYDTIPQAEARDEIGQLSVEFNQMTLQIKSLIDDVYVADIQKKDLELQRRKAQLNALQSQINPHFLFNALETIRMRSLMKKETETAKIIHSMAKIFRTSLTWNKDRVTIKDEMEFILCFLEIQKYRFEDRLNYHIDIDESAYPCMVPKMMFLPFVENASIHGIEPLKQGGIIDIRIERIGEDMVFSIHDNGLGMNPEKVRQLYNYLESDEVMGERIGVQNVIYRLKLIYGNLFSFTIDSELGNGTLIRLKIPVDN
jgi:two-component system sensor histidine kinase YesM